MEYDFRGFFNNVKVSAVGDVLHKFYMPKYMVGYLVTLMSQDVENITIGEARRLVNSEDPTQAGWVKA